MHESSVVGALVRHVNAVVEDKGSPARLIRLRTTTAFPEATVRHFFAMHAAGTPLEQVPLEISVDPLRRSCLCGRDSVIHKEDLTGHMHFCAACHLAITIEEEYQVECREIEFEAAALQG